MRTQARGQTDVVAATAADLFAPPRDRAAAEARRRGGARGARPRDRARRGGTVAGGLRRRRSSAPATRTARRWAALGRPVVPEPARQPDARAEHPRDGGAGAERHARTVVGAVRDHAERLGGPAGGAPLDRRAAARRRDRARARPARRRRDRAAGRAPDPPHRAAAARVAAGDLDTRVALEGSTEERSLARSFNEMTDRIRDMLGRQQAFVADASHQLRTPLSGAAAAARGGERGGRLAGGRGGAGRRRARGRPHRSARRRAARAVERRRARRVGRADRPRRRRCVGASPVGAARARAEPSMSCSRIRRRRRSCRRARADVDRALDALVENALRYAPAGSTVELRAVGETIEVVDEGPGIEPDEAEAVFERFHRGASRAPPPGGTGLGLTIARDARAPLGGRRDARESSRDRCGSARRAAPAALGRRFAGGPLASCRCTRARCSPGSPSGSSGSRSQPA